MTRKHGARKGWGERVGKVEGYRSLAEYWKRKFSKRGRPREERRTKLRVAGGGEVRWKGGVARELARK